MNFADAYGKMKAGCSISKPGLGFALRFERGMLYKDPQVGTSRPVFEFNASMIEMFAQNDWFVKTEPVDLRHKVIIKFKKIRQSGWLEPQAPFHAHEDDRGFDLTCVAIDRVEEYVWRYHSGLAFAFPEGIDGEVRARSSIYKTGLILSNGVGTIDHGYTGEVQAVFYEIFSTMISDKMYEPGERFCQLVIPGVDPRQIVFEEVEELPTTTRGAGGYGSTGK